MNLDLLLNGGEINKYFYDQLSRNLHYLSEDLQKTYIDEAKAMTSIGINNAQDQKEFYYISSYVPDILDDIVGQKSGLINNINDVIEYVYVNRKTRPIDNLMSFFDAVAVAANDLGLQVKPAILNRIKISPKHAYPQGLYGAPMQQNYDIQRWMQAMRDIYSRAKSGLPLEEAKRSVIEQWDKMEKIDFLNWMRFYQEGAHLKYKQARMIDSDEGGYYVPMVHFTDDLKAKLPIPEINFPPKAEEPKPEPPKPDVNNVRDTIEKQRARLIGRLNSAEKLLASLEGQAFAGIEQELMLRLLQDLKRKIQTANKLSINSSLFEDFIYRTGNYLKEQSKIKQANFFYKIAQVADPAAALLEGLPEEPPTAESAPPIDTTEPIGMPASNDDDTHKAFKEFFALLENGVPETDDDLQKGSADEFSDIVVYSQLVPPQPQAKPMMPLPQKKEEPSLETSLPAEEQASPVGDNVDDAISNALGNITVADIVKRLELLSGLFKKREIARQLAIIDMMMDKLGIGSFFPSMGEATRSALESNQYVSTRVEDVLSKLRGTMHSDQSESLLDMETPPPETQGLRNSLVNQDKKEQERKERRQEQAEAKMMGGSGGAGQQAPQDLGAPVQVQQSKPLPQIR